MATRQKFFAVARKHDIEINDDGPNQFDGHRHIHAYAPIGFHFEGSTAHNACCYDGWADEVDWAGALEEIRLASCPPDCECRSEDDDQ
jgi:hypothetical protein